MKRSLFFNPIKLSMLAVPAAALMLGAAQAGTTIGINFAGGAYTTYSANNFYNGYGYCGFPVTATAFGVAPSNWYTTTNSSATETPYSASATGTMIVGPASTLSVSWIDNNFWGSDIDYQGIPGGLVNAAGIPTVPPGNDQVTWGFLDDNATGWEVDLAGLNATFPNGYVIQCIGPGATSLSRVTYTDSATFTNLLGMTAIYTAGNSQFSGQVGLQTNTPDWDMDTLTFISPSRNDTKASLTLSGFIITDQPVVSQDPPGVTNLADFSFTLTPVVVALTNNLAYQWWHNGALVPGATNATYTKAAAAFTDAGTYSVVVTNLYGAATSGVAQVAILPAVPWVWQGNLSDVWDISTTANWATNGLATTYADGDLVQFDDTALVTNISAEVAVSPFSIIVTNNAKSIGIGGNSIAGSTGIIKSGTNLLSLTGSNTFTGKIIINAGSVSVDGAGQLGGGTYAPAITNYGGFIYTSSAAQTLSGAMSGTGSLTMSSTNELTLAADDPLTGGIFVNNGTLRITPENFDLQFTPSLVTINPNGTLLSDNYHALGYSTAVLINGGTWLLNYEDYKLSVTMIDGQINAGPAGNGGQLRLGYFGVSTITVTNSVVGSVINETVNEVSDNNIMNVYRGAAASDLTINGIIFDSGGLVKNGNGVLTLTAPNTYTGPTIVNAGILEAVNVASSDVTVNSGGTLLVASPTVSSLSANSLTLSSGSTIALRVDKTGGAVNSDSIQGISSVTYGGSLVVSNVTSDSSLLALGDTLQLFPSGITYAGAFSSYTLPTLPAGLSWDVTQLVINGTLVVSDVAGAPTFSPAAGSYYGALPITISSTTPGATIYYTTNGGTPTTSSPHGASPLTVIVPANANITVSAFAAEAGMTSSAIESATYTTATPTYISLVMGSTPTAFWPLSEAAGPTAYDVYQSGPNGAYNSAGVTYSVAGPAGSTVVTMDGSSGKVTIPYTMALNPSGPFTVEAWLNPAAVSSSLLCALSSVYVTSPRQGWLIYESTSGWEFRTYDANTTATAVDITGGAPTVGQWDHVAAVWDGSKGYLYVNGVLAKTSPATNYVANTSAAFTIGARSDSAFIWGGSVGDVAFYGRALSAAEIQSHVAEKPVLNIAAAGTNLVVSWLPAGGGTLLASPTVNGTFTNVPSANSPWTTAPKGNSFFRVKY